MGEGTADRTRLKKMLGGDFRNWHFSDLGGSRENFRSLKKSGHTVDGMGRGASMRILGSICTLPIRYATTEILVSIVESVSP